MPGCDRAARIVLPLLQRPASSCLGYGLGLRARAGAPQCCGRGHGDAAGRCAVPVFPVPGQRGGGVSLRAPPARVLNHGAARDGVSHWWVQRVTALALAPLSVWLTVSLLCLPTGSYAAVTGWIGSGLHPVLLGPTTGLPARDARPGLPVRHPS